MQPHLSEQRLINPSQFWRSVVNLIGYTNAMQNVILVAIDGLYALLVDNSKNYITL
jgi:hypothetical protein